MKLIQKIVLVALFALAVPVHPVQAADPQFFSGSPVPDARTMTALTWHPVEQRMFMGYGYRSPWDYNDLWRSLTDDPRGTWKRIYGPMNGNGDMPVIPRSYVLGTYFSGTGSIHYFGGYYKPGDDSNTCRVIKQHVSTTNGKDIAIWQTPTWEAREAQGVAEINNKLLMVGGITYCDIYGNRYPNSGTRTLADAYWFDANGDWTLAFSSAPWGALRSMGVQTLGGYVHVFGGFDNSGPVKSHWIWDGVNYPIQLPDMPEPNAVFYDFVIDNKICMVGGNDGVAQHAKARCWDDVNGWVNHPNFIGGALVGSRASVVPASGGNPEEAMIPYPATNGPNTGGFPSSGWNIRAELWGAKMVSGSLVFTRYNSSTLDTTP